MSTSPTTGHSKRPNFFRRMFNMSDKTPSKQTIVISSPKLTAADSAMFQSKITTVIVQPATGSSANAGNTGSSIQPNFKVISSKANDSINKFSSIPETNEKPEQEKPEITINDTKTPEIVVKSVECSPKSLGGSNSSVAGDSHSDTSLSDAETTTATTIVSPAKHQVKARVKNLEIRPPSRIYKKLIDPSTLSDDELVRRFLEGNLTNVAISHNQVASYLGDANRSALRSKYMQFFDWQGSSIMTALRNVCDKLYMRAESQQLDRIIEAFAERWCACNPDHGFKSSSVVYTIAYSILLLNTDRYSEDVAASKRITRAQYVLQTFEAIKTHVEPEEETESSPTPEKLSMAANNRASTDLGRKPSSAMKRWSANFSNSKVDNTTLVSDTTVYPLKEWESIIISLLKGVYTSIDLTPLTLASEETIQEAVIAVPLTSSPIQSSPMLDPQQIKTNNSSYLNAQRSPRTPTSPLMEPPKVYLHGQSSVTSLNSRYNGHGLLSKLNLNRRSSFDTSHSSPYMQSSRKTQTVAMQPGEHFGFSGALRSAIHREKPADEQTNGLKVGDQPCNASELYSISESFASATSFTTSINPGPALHNETLELRGAPWAKEGLLRFYSFVNASGHVNKLRAFQPKKKDWIEGFVIVQRGYLRIFRFDVPMMKSASSDIPAGEGNWLERAVMTDNIPLCHCMAQLVPDEAVSKGSRNGLAISNTSYSQLATKMQQTHWCLTLANDTVLVFKSGTSDIAEEYVYACNYWAARVSREPLVESVTSAEYGWNIPIKVLDQGRLEQGPSYFPRLVSYNHDTILFNGQKVHFRQWHGPVPSTNISYLEDEEQLVVSRRHKEQVEQQLGAHNALRSKLTALFPSKFPASDRVMDNWERKSQYLLKENIKYDLYIAALDSAISDRADNNKN